MNCSLLSFNVECISGPVAGWLAPLWTYAVFGFWAIVVLVVVAILALVFTLLARIQNMFGVPPSVARGVVIAAVSAFAAFVFRGHLDAEVGQPVKVPGHPTPLVVKKKR